MQNCYTETNVWIFKRRDYNTQLCFQLHIRTAWLNQKASLTSKGYRKITCKKTPGENSETIPSFLVKSTILKISITAGWAYFPNFKTKDQNICSTIWMSKFILENRSRYIAVAKTKDWYLLSSIE